LRTLAAYRLMKVVAADVHIDTSGFAVQVGSGERDIIVVPEHCWLGMGRLMLDCTLPIFPSLWPGANWEIKPGEIKRLVTDTEWLEYLVEPDGSLERPPSLGQCWLPPGLCSAEFTRRIQKTQLKESSRILHETERLRAVAAERQGKPYSRDDTVYPLKIGWS
jgi:hypothetical protein